MTKRALIGLFSVIFVLVAFFIGVNQGVEANNYILGIRLQEQQELSMDAMGHAYFRNVEIDGCQYIILKLSPGGIAMVHKANCRNPIHR